MWCINPHGRVRTCEVAYEISCDHACGKTCVDVFVTAMARVIYSIVRYFTHVCVDDAR